MFTGVEWSHHVEDLHTIFLVVTIGQTVDPVGVMAGQSVVSRSVGHDRVELGRGPGAEGGSGRRGDWRVDTVTVRRHRGITLSLLVSLGQ